MAGLQACARNVIFKKFYKPNRGHVVVQIKREKHKGIFLHSVKSLSFQSNLKTLSINFHNLYRHCSSNIYVGQKLEGDISKTVNDFSGSKTSSDNLVSTNGASLDSSTSFSGKSLNTSTLVEEPPSNIKNSSEEVSNIIDSNNALPSMVTNGDSIVIDESLLPPIPTTVPEELSQKTLESVSTLLDSGLTEPTLKSLGLGNWWPPGLIQQLLEFLHINFELPWWGAIAVVTATMRIFIFPLNVKARKNAILMQNHLPQIQKYQMEIEEAKLSGNYYEVAGKMQEFHNFIRDKKIVTLGFFLPTLAQTPIFLSMFWGLRGMTNLPVESMKTGGVLWFTDLTIADPYYCLPVIISATLYLIFESGAEGNSVAAIQQVWLRYGLRAMPLIILPFCAQFSSALQCYWTVSNFASLSTVLIMKIPAVKKYFNIPDVIRHDPSKLVKKTKGLGEIKKSLSNAKILREIQDRERLNTVTFEKAGTEPVPRTFKTNPLKK